MELSGRVVASVPTLDCNEFLLQAVESVLQQTYSDLDVVVVSDGDGDDPWSALEGVKDPRLKRVQLSSSMGPYFIHDLVLRSAEEAEFLLIQDADDWSEPVRVELLLAELTRRDLVGVTSGQFYEGLYQSYATTFCAPLRPEWYLERGRHHGLYRRAGLMEAGGYFGGSRYAFDSFVVNSLYVCNAIGYVDVPLYHRRRRDGSLSRSPETGTSSTARADYVVRLVKAWRELLQCAEQASGGTSLLPEVARLVASFSTGRQRAILDGCVRQLAEALPSWKPGEVLAIEVEATYGP